MKRILFVDDEQSLLDGLQNRLRKQRKQWEMVFALGGGAALAEMEKAPFDVVVSDMRMPGIDGAALLAETRLRYPSTMRIVLSGHAEREDIVRVLPVANQFLSKPCDAEALREVIERTCQLHSFLEDGAIRAVVGRLDRLPSVPQTYWELTRAVGNPNVGISEIAKIVEKDPAMSVKVLQLVNSAYFGLGQRMTSIKQAVAYLGIELLKGLVLTAHVFDTLNVAPIDGFSIDRLQDDALRTAKLAKRFMTDPKRGEEAFTAALVHDVGKAVLAMYLPEQFRAAVQSAKGIERPFHQVEKELLGVTHAEIGGYLLGVWGLPFPIVEAVAFHHCPGRVTHRPCDVLAAVHVADALVDGGGHADVPAGDEMIDIAFLTAAGLASELPRWRGIALEELEATTGGRAS